MRTAVLKAQVQELIRKAPFQPFVLNMENGDRILIEHPENIAFDPTADESGGRKDFYVISRRLRVWSTFEAVSSVAVVDQEGQVA